MTDTLPSLFDPPEVVDEARDDGIGRADAHADPEWRVAAMQGIALLARTGEPFTADEVLAYLDSVAQDTHNLAALGPLFQRAARSGLIVKTGRQVRTKLARRHRDLTEWIGANR